MEEIAPWTMAEDGEWVLNEPYASAVWDIRVKATDAFQKALCEELAKITNYSVEELVPEYVRRCVERTDSPVDKVESFIIEAMSGQLYS